MKNRELIIISGFSGSGKSTALATLEDAGYFAIDNLPAPLFLPLLDLLKQKESPDSFRKLAIAMDAREKSFVQNFEKYLETLKARHIPYKIFFLAARESVLIKRFSETRRRHPLAPKDRVSRGIHRERLLLHPLREASTQVIDTSHLNVHQLREKILTLVHQQQKADELLVTLVSFGYRYGLPLEADLIFDVRFLPNPFFVRSLRALSGKNPRVARFVLQKSETKKILNLMRILLSRLLKHYLKEGKAYLTIGVGCTGGRHRSVAVIERMSHDLKKMGYPVMIHHRDFLRA